MKTVHATTMELDQTANSLFDRYFAAFEYNLDMTSKQDEPETRQEYVERTDRIQARLSKIDDILNLIHELKEMP